VSTARRQTAASATALVKALRATPELRDELRIVLGIPEVELAERVDALAAAQV
jgi:hypothetical protein